MRKSTWRNRKARTHRRQGFLPRPFSERGDFARLSQRLDDFRVGFGRRGAVQQCGSGRLGSGKDRFAPRFDVGHVQEERRESVPAHSRRVVIVVLGTGVRQVVGMDVVRLIVLVPEDLQRHKSVRVRARIENRVLIQQEWYCTTHLKSVRVTFAVRVESKELETPPNNKH
jgi:hypothetical protein